MNYLHPELIDRLAAEYVLGTLTGPARRRFERLIKEHDMVRRRVNVWQDKFTPLAANLAPVTPPDRIWQSLAQRLQLRGVQTERRDWFDSLAFWRGASVVSALLALCFVVALVVQQPANNAGAASVVAVLNSQQGEARLVASFDDKRGTLQLAAVGQLAAPSGRDLELWALPQGGAPVSLGLVRVLASAPTQLNAAQFAAFRRSGGLAVSIEPTGGSPTGAPTGQITFTGKLLLGAAA